MAVQLLGSKKSAAAAPAGAPQQVMLSSEQFLQMTDLKKVKVASAVPYVDNGVSKFQLPSAGMCSVLFLGIQASITVAGTVTSGTFAKLPYPAPFSLLRRLKFGNNNSFSLLDLTGWGLYKWVCERYGVEAQPNGVANPYTTQNNAYVGAVNSSQIVPGANVSAGTYTFNLTIPVPIAYNEAGEQGLLVLQQNSTFYTVELDWGQVVGGIGATGGSNDVFSSLVGTGLSITANITATLGMDYFEYLPQTQALTSMFMSCQESVAIPTIIAGENVYKLPVGDFYTMMMMEIVNNSAAVAPANISNILLKYGGNIYKYQEDYLSHLAASFFHHEGIVPRDGNIIYDFGIRRGLLSRRDRIDAFNNQNVTNTELHFTLPGTLSITGTNQASIILEKLTYTSQ